MEKTKRNISNVLGFMGLLGFALAALASSSAKDTYSSWNGSYGQQAVQHLHQSSQGGTYVGNFSSQEEARAAAARAGFASYQYYPSTGECFGY